MSWNTRKSKFARTKPDGGFVFISAMALIAAWWAYKRGLIRLSDLRVWFACHELVARRSGNGPDRFPRYCFDEVQGLVGGAGSRHIKTAVERLIRAGLLAWSEREIRFPAVTDAGLMSQADGLPKVVQLVTNHRRKVPVPRRIIRVMAGGARPVVIATILGHLLRCLYYRDRKCQPEGRCKASWIAEAFGVDVRNVKAARKYLIGTRWLEPLSAHQNQLNRWGARIRINLGWPGHPAGGESKRSPRTGSSATESPPLYKNNELSSRSEHQKPAERGPSGISGAGRKPSLRNVVAEDLKDPRRTESLREQAMAGGLIGRSEADQLRFHGAAEHARLFGTSNPCGLFVSTLRNRRWNVVKLDEEDRARRRLRWLREIAPPLSMPATHVNQYPRERGQWHSTAA